MEEYHGKRFVIFKEYGQADRTAEDKRKLTRWQRANLAEMTNLGIQFPSQFYNYDRVYTAFYKK